MHVPIAGDLCQASADLLFSEAPIVTVEDGTQWDRTRDRLEDLVGDDFHAALISGAEIAAALGGTFLRVSWDPAVVPDRPFLTTVDYDSAFPVFRHGRLTAVTFVTVLDADTTTVLRQIEHHETDEHGVGIIRHGLFEGTATNLGTPRSLDSRPETADLAGKDGTGVWSTETPGLAVAHWPNLAPNRLWRTSGTARHLGRSDLEAKEALLDSIDETWTSLMRDVRLGKSMLMVSRSMVENHGPGAGVTFGHDEVYFPVNAAPASAQDARLPVEQIQFAIRVEEHERTLALLWNTLIRAAGYSPQTLGEGTDGAAMTATEVAAKERRSTTTKARKAGAVLPALETIIRKMLAVDAALFGGGGDPEAPFTVEIADGFQDTPEALAARAQSLADALAASIDTRVRIANPGKDEAWILAEVEKIKAENGLALADPLTLGVDGAGLDASFPPPADPEADPAAPTNTEET